MPVPIALITTIYNRQPYLAATIESILAQTYCDFEYVLWDDGSTDGSLAIAQHYALKDDRIRVIAAPHQGIALALRSAIAATTGTYQWKLSQHRPVQLVARTATLEPLPR